MLRCRAKIIIDECKLAIAKMTRSLYKATWFDWKVSRDLWESHKLDNFDKNALSNEMCFFSGDPRAGAPGTCHIGPMGNPPLPSRRCVHTSALQIASSSSCTGHISWICLNKFEF